MNLLGDKNAGTWRIDALGVNAINLMACATIIYFRTWTLARIAFQGFVANFIVMVDGIAFRMRIIGVSILLRV
jgi:hypothetical protein